MSYGEDFTLTLFTNDPQLARLGDRAGIDRIGPDLEQLGKAERQGHLKTWISDHEEADLGHLRPVLAQARLFARTNPVHPGSADEIERLLAAGAEVLMLPMFRKIEEAQAFVDLIGGRARVCLLVETAAAATRIERIVRIPGVDEIHVGLNDLHLDLRLSSHFELLTSEFLRFLADIVHAAGLPFGFGGIARAGDNDLPIPSRLVYAQYPRLGASMALVSRSFFRQAPGQGEIDVAGEIALARSLLDELAGCGPEELEQYRQELRQLALAGR
jgi:hypothetical protein